MRSPARGLRSAASRRSRAAPLRRRIVSRTTAERTACAASPKAHTAVTASASDSAPRTRLRAPAYGAAPSIRARNNSIQGPACACCRIPRSQSLACFMPYTSAAGQNSAIQPPLEATIQSFLRKSIVTILMVLGRGVALHPVSIHIFMDALGHSCFRELIRSNLIVMARVGGAERGEIFGY
jgi:hypothetical protein